MVSAISYFNPRADFGAVEKFKLLERNEKIKVIALTILGAFLLGIGAVAAFRWGVKRYSHDASKIYVPSPENSSEMEEELAKLEAKRVGIEKAQQDLERETEEEKEKIMQGLKEWEAGFIAKIARHGNT